MKERLVRLGKDGRVSLGRFGVKPGDTFEVSRDDNGRILLKPVTVTEKGPSSDD